jgi:hypothetical protein
MTEPQRRLLYWEVEEWPQAVNIARGLHNWLFRGQDSANWRLKTNFERLARQFGMPIDCRADVEKNILLTFTRQAHHHIRPTPASMKHLEWLSIMQHYGGPTRLLDFTYSFYVAVFFAVESANELPAVWAINRTKLDKRILRRVNPEKDGNGAAGIRSRARKIVGSCLKGHQELGVVVVEPWRLNKRMVTQQGVFLFPTDIRESFEKNLCHSLGLRCNSLPEKEVMGSYNELRQATQGGGDELVLIKFTFPQRIHHEIMTDLKKMNITSASLFPGLDGFARSFRMSMRLFDGFREATRTPEDRP